MRIWLLALLASCWTGPVAPTPVVPAAAAMPVASRPALKPSGYFVQDLITHRLETRAFEDVDLLGGEFAVLTRPRAAIQPRALVVLGRGVIRLDAFSSSPVGTGFGVDAHSVVEYCIDVSGRVTSAHIATHGEARPLNVVTPSDHDVLERLRGWLFTPYFVDGKPVMACSFIDYAAIAP